MSNIFKENAKLFGGGEDPEYSFFPEHIRREQIALDLISQLLGAASNETLEPSKILSVACSTGIFEQRIKEQLAVEVFGIEGDIQATKKAESRGVFVACGDVEWLPFPNEFFDLIYAGEIIEHLFDVRQFLSELNRVLKDDGSFVLTTPNLAKLDDRIKFLFGKSPRQVNAMHEYLYLHIRPFTLNSIKNALKEYGFLFMEARSNVIRVDFGDRKYLNYSNLLNRLFPGVGATLIVSSKKIESIKIK